MTTTPEHDERIAKMTFESVYLAVRHFGVYPFF